MSALPLTLTAAALAAAAGAYIYTRPSPPSLYSTPASHTARRQPILTSLLSRPPGSKLSLHNRTLQSNTIRNASHKSHPSYFPIDLSSFHHILEINTDEGYVIVEPGVSFGDLLHELLKVGMTPLVVPELPGITVGGAIAGGGLESSSHRYGQVSDTVLEIECLTPELRVCSPTLLPDLFYAISASYNTCALMTRVKLRIGPAPKYVSVQAELYGGWAEAVEALQGGESDTIEGLAFSPTEILVIRGTHTNTPLSPIRQFSRHWDQWYYKSIRSTPAMTIPYADYCFRYNYGSFWMADYVLGMLGGDNLLTRSVIGAFLDTKHLFAVLHSADLTHLGRMRVIQDCYIPADRAVEFLEAEEKEVGVWPLWLCPIKGTSTGQVLASHYSEEEETFINVGIYGRPAAFPFDARAVHSGIIERLIEVGGRSMLYAQTWHTPEQFKAIYGAALEEVEGVKGRYGEEAFFGLYEKVALSQADREELGRPMKGSEAEETRKVVRDILGKKLGLS